MEEGIPVSGIPNNITTKDSFSIIDSVLRANLNVEARQDEWETKPNLGLGHVCTVSYVLYDMQTNKEIRYESVNSNGETVNELVKFRFVMSKAKTKS